MKHLTASQSAICAVERSQRQFQEHCADLMDILTTGPIELGPDETKEIDLAALKAVQLMRPVVVPRRDPILRGSSSISEDRTRVCALSIIEEYREGVLHLMQSGTFLRGYTSLLASTIKRIRADKAAKYPILSFSNQMLAICLEEVFSL